MWRFKGKIFASLEFRIIWSFDFEGGFVVFCCGGAVGVWFPWSGSTEGCNSLVSYWNPLGTVRQYVLWWLNSKNWCLVAVIVVAVVVVGGAGVWLGGRKVNVPVLLSNGQNSWPWLDEVAAVAGRVSGFLLIAPFSRHFCCCSCCCYCCTWSRIFSIKSELKAFCRKIEKLRL